MRTAGTYDLAIKTNDELAGIRYDFFAVDQDGERWDPDHATMSRHDGEREGTFGTREISFGHAVAKDYPPDTSYAKPFHSSKID